MIDLNHCRKTAWPILLGLLLLAAPAAVQAQTFYYGPFTCETNADGISVTITEYPVDYYNINLGGNVSIPATIYNLPVTSIGFQAFLGCYFVTKVTIPASVTSIGDNAFYGCYELTSVTIPASVTSIGEGSFSGCTGLTAIAVDPNNSFFSDVDGVLFNQSQTTLIQYPPGLVGSYNIPGSVTIMETNAFYGCAGLTGITIPGSVTSIGDSAFEGCDSLTNATLANGVAIIGQDAFDGTGLTSITIPGSVTSIGDYAFFYCARLTNVTIANGVTSIGAYAFSGVFSGDPLTRITIPGSVTNIGTNAFERCSQLGSITIANGVTSLGEDMFYGCTGLTNVTIPGSVTNIGEKAFCACGRLTSVFFQGNAPSNDFLDFYADPKATGYYLPGTTGWSDFSANTGLPAVMWNPLIQVGDGSFGVQNNQFGFNITGTNNFTVVVAACTNLAGAVWVPLTTNTLVKGSFYFSDPQWTNYPNRFYSLQMP